MVGIVCRLCPTSPRMGQWRDCHIRWRRHNLDVISQSRDLMQWLGEADPSAIAYLDQAGSNHDHSLNT